MNRSKVSLVIVVLAILALAPAAGSAPAAPSSTVPTVVSYQGHVLVDGVPFGSPASASGYFKLALVDSLGTFSYWSNDGSSVDGSPPEVPVMLPVTNGLFSVLLGDTTLEGMKEVLSEGAFADPATYLRVWFSPSEAGTYTRLADRRIASVPYALRAERSRIAAVAEVANQATSADQLDSYHASAFQKHYANVIVVAKSGGDFTSIQAAIDSVMDASATNRYLVWVAPGEYTEYVVMEPHVDVEGVGDSSTVITQTGNDAIDVGTVLGSANSELRRLTVKSTGGATRAVAILNAGEASTLTQVTATASGGTENTIGVFNYSTWLEMKDVKATATCPSSAICTGVHNENASPVMTDVWAGAYDGSENTGVYNLISSPLMTRVTAVAYNGDKAVAVAAVGSGSAPVMRYLVAEASGGVTENYGIETNRASVTIENSTIRSVQYGITAQTLDVPVTIQVSNSQVSAAANTIAVCNAGTTTLNVRVGATLLSGGPASVSTPWGCMGTMTMTCAGVYDENYAFYSSTCP